MLNIGSVGMKFVVTWYTVAAATDNRPVGMNIVRQNVDFVGHAITLVTVPSPYDMLGWI